MDVDKLKALWYDINQYGEYLQNNTYNPYDKVQEFARRLKRIIEDDTDENLSISEEYCSPEEYFDEWFAYCPPEDKNRIYGYSGVCRRTSGRTRQGRL